MSKKLTTEDFIAKANLLHCNKYDYSKSIYDGNHKKVCIICPEHGEFWQTPSNHLNGQGCPKCGQTKRAKTQTLTKDDFIKKAIKIHGNKYNYDKIEYVNYHTKVCITCQYHGDFWQEPANHIHKTRPQDCPKCKGTKISQKVSKTTDDFIKKAKLIHGGKYDYSETEYVKSDIPVQIICPYHGAFWQIPDNHIHKTHPHGCPICNTSTLEVEIKNLLIENNIPFTTQQRFDWLGKQTLDFYIPSKNIAIECQGIQHFKPKSFFGGEESFKDIVERDDRKRNLCEKNNLKLIYFSNVGIKYPYNVIEDKNKLLKLINE